MYTILPIFLLWLGGFNEYDDSIAFLVGEFISGLTYFEIRFITHSP
jgi:hypothetical protein